MKIEMKKATLDQLGTDALVIFVSRKQLVRSGEKKKKDQAFVEGVSRAIHARLETSIQDGVLTGKANECVLFRDAGLAGCKHLLAVGIGEARDLDHEVLRQASASAITALKGNKIKSVCMALDSLPHNGIAADAATQALTEGAELTSYRFTDYKEKKDENGPEQLFLVTMNKAKSYERGVEVGLAVGEAVNFSRWLGDRPGNRMTPSIMAEETIKAAKGTKLKVTAWDKARIKAEKMGSFLSVSLGSSQDPRLIVMEYNGAAGSKKPLCLVGKGLTFDSGGISIKPSASMEEMKFDKCGGAAVIATMLLIAKLKLRINAIGIVPATENMPGPNANKPGDIVVARNGKSIEINNTDAEGRLILADALVYACEQKPAMILDAATLTGAMVMALGNLHTGVFTRNDRLFDKIQKAAQDSGEWIWRMPLTDQHVKDMKGTYADLSNISSGKGAGSATAAGFLEQFVDKDIPWAHFDIAGTGWHCGDRLPYCPKKGATGVMVRTFLQIAMKHSS